MAPTYGLLKAPALKHYDRQTATAVSGPYQQVNMPDLGAGPARGLAHFSAGLEGLSASIEKAAAQQALAELSADLNEIDRRNIEWLNTYSNEHKGGRARNAAAAYEQHFQEIIGGESEYGLNLRAKYARNPEATRVLQNELGRRFNHGYANALKYQTGQTDIFLEEQGRLAWENHRATLNSPAADEAVREQSLRNTIQMTQQLYPGLDPQSLSRELSRRDRSERVRAGINSGQWGEAEQWLNASRDEIEPDEFHNLQNRIAAGKTRHWRELTLSLGASRSMAPSNLQSIRQTGAEVNGAMAEVALREQLALAPQGTLALYQQRVDDARRYYQAVNSPDMLGTPWHERQKNLTAAFAAEAAAPPDSQAGQRWNSLYGEFVAQRQAFAKDPVACNEAAVQEIMDKRDYPGLAAEELAPARERDRAALNLELQHLQSGGQMRPRLFSNQYAQNWKAEFERAAPEAKARMLAAIGHAYEDLADEAMAELKLSPSAGIAAKLMANPAGASEAGLLLQHENSGVNRLLSGNPDDIRAADIEASVSAASHSAGFGQALAALAGAAESGAPAHTAAMRQSMEKLAACYVGAGMGLSDAANKAVSAFSQTWSGLADEHMALLLPADLDAAQVRAGLTLAGQLCGPAGPDTVNGLWRNLGGSDVGWWSPEANAWIYGRDKRIIRLNLRDAERLGAMAQGGPELGRASANPAGCMSGRQRENLSASLRAMLDSPGNCALANQYRDMRFALA